MKKRFYNLIQGMLTRKFLLAVISAVFTALNYIIGWGLDEAQIALILSPIGVWILAEGTADVAERIKTTVRTVQSVSSAPAASDEDVFAGTKRIITGDEKNDEE